jgi:hypothetical protein
MDWVGLLVQGKFQTREQPASDQKLSSAQCGDFPSLLPRMYKFSPAVNLTHLRHTAHTRTRPLYPLS